MYTFKMAALTLFYAAKCAHLVHGHTTSAQRLCSIDR